MPKLIVLADPNGAGKSSLTKLSTANIPLIDPDAIAREISPESPETAALAAGRQAIGLAREYIQSVCSFVVETTLAGNTYLKLMQEAKELGWFVALTYIGINNPTTIGGHLDRSSLPRSFDGVFGQSSSYPRVKTFAHSQRAGVIYAIIAPLS